MNKVIKGLLLTVGMGMAISASAATYNLGTLPAGDTIFGTNSVGVGAFSDTIDFSLGGPANVESAVSSLSLTLGHHSIENISGLNVSVYNSSNTLLGSGSDVVLSGIQSAGNYHAIITGSGTGKVGGMYAGVFSVSAVPEPSTWGMLLMGLGLLGFVSRKKA